MKRFFLLGCLCFSAIAHAQKFYFTGFEFRWMPMYNSHSSNEEIHLIRAMPADSAQAALTGKISERAASETYKNVNDPLSVLYGGINLRPNTTTRVFKWSELNLGLGVGIPRSYGQNFTEVPVSYSQTDSSSYRMYRETSRRSGLILEARLLFHSSPYRSRMMYYGGLGLRAGVQSDRNNTLNITRRKYADPYHFSESSYKYSLPNNLSNMLGGFVSTGLKYNISCKINLFTDLNFGYSHCRYHPGNAADGFMFAFNLGIKYKIGNAPVPGETNNSNSESTKNRKGLTPVQW